MEYLLSLVINNGVHWVLFAGVLLAALFLTMNYFDKKYYDQKLTSDQPVDRHTEENRKNEIRNERLNDGKKLWMELLKSYGSIIDQDLPILNMKKQGYIVRNEDKVISIDQKGWNQEIKTYIIQELLKADEIIPEPTKMKIQQPENLLPWFFQSHMKNPVIRKLFNKYQVPASDIWGSDYYNQERNSNYWTAVRLSEVLLDYLYHAYNFRSHPFSRTMKLFINHGVNRYVTSYYEGS